MAENEKSTRMMFRFLLVVQLTGWLVPGVVDGFVEGDEGNKSGRSFVSEHFMPISLPLTSANDFGGGREAESIEGSGDAPETEDKKTMEEVSSASKDGLVDAGRIRNNGTDLEEGSGDHEDVEDLHVDVPLIGDSEVLTTTSENLEVTKEPNETFAASSTLGATVSNEVDDDGKESAATKHPETDISTATTKEDINVQVPESSNESSTEEVTQAYEDVTQAYEDVYTARILTEMTIHPSTSPPPASSTSMTSESPPESSEPIEMESEKPFEERTETSEENLSTTTTLPPPILRAEPVNEPINKVTKLLQKPLEALPRNIIHTKNESGIVDSLLVTNLDPTESEAQMDETVSRKLGAYIVITLILLSFFSLVGYILMKKRQNRKRRSDFEGNQESHDTEKALLSLSDYKDHSELEENHLKNNEITPMIVKSNPQINRYEKNTNFSFPKNLNTMPAEKNVEKDNVLKSTTENLSQVGVGPVTQAIVEEHNVKDPTEEDKSLPDMEKLIVKTLIDQDSIPKKPIIINRSSTGYVSIPQDNS